jgi:hypothetical protein
MILPDDLEGRDGHFNGALRVDPSSCLLGICEELGSKRATGRAGILDAYRGSPPKRISSPAQIEALSRATARSAYFGA